MMVLKEVHSLKGFSNALIIPEELRVKLMNCDEEEVVGTVSDFCVETGKTWRELKKILIEMKEIRAVEVISLMEQYVCEGLLLLLHIITYIHSNPLLSQTLLSQLNTCMKW